MLEPRVRPVLRAAGQRGAGRLVLPVLAVLLAPPACRRASALPPPAPLIQTAGAAAEERLLAQAQQRFDRHDYAGAARLYEQVLSADPKSLPALNNLGVVYARMGNYAAAAKAYEKALALEPHSFALLLNLGLSCFKSGDYPHAVRPLERALEIQPQNFQARSLLAMAYYSQKDFESASRQFEKLSAAQPANQQVQYLLAESYLWSGQERLALETFQRILHKSPDSAAAHMLVGEADDGLDRTDEAIQEFQAAARIAPAQPNVHFGLGYLYWKKREYERASAEFEREIANGGSVAKSKAYLGDIAMRNGQDAAARALLSEALRLYPDVRIAYYDLGILEARQKHYDQAAARFERAIALDPNRADAHYRLAETLRAQGKNALAEQEMNRVARIHETQRANLVREISGPPSVAASQ